MSNNKVQYAYTPEGWLETIVKADGSVISFTYDKTGYLLSQKLGEEHSISSEYNEIGKQTKVSSLEGDICYQYADVYTIIMDGTSGYVFFSMRGGKSGKDDWLSEDGNNATALGHLNFRPSIEWAAVIDRVFGMPGDTHWRHVLPTENDISQKEALEIAKAAVSKRLGALNKK